MVLESLVGPIAAEKRPWELFFLGLLFASVAMFLSLWIFREQASLVMVFLTVIAAVPLMYKTIKLEEFKDTKINKETTLLKEHAKALSFFVALFLGILLAFSIWYVFLPSDVVQATFSTQIQTIAAINAKIAANPVLGNALISSQSAIDTSSVSASNLFMQIFSNNIKVLLFSIFFSFLFGAGAIFILTWNASVISAAIGTFVRNNISMYANEIGLFKIGGYFHIFSLGLLKYMIHGVPEILAYFIGGLAGGIISVAIIKHDFGTKQFKHILFDSLDLIVLAIVILFIAGLLEVFVTPILF